MFLLFVLFVVAGIILVVTGLAFLIAFLGTLFIRHVSWSEFALRSSLAGLFLSIGLIIVLRYLPLATIA